MMIDFHTHNLSAPPGTAIVNLPLPYLVDPSLFIPSAGGLYSVGIHPWWTAQADIEKMWQGMKIWLAHPQVVAIGECGLDRLHGADLGDIKNIDQERKHLDTQNAIFLRQIEWSEQYEKPVTIHCVRAFDLLLADKKLMQPTQRWTIHGFRGKPVLARQLLSAGLDLSFGEKHHPESYALTPPERRHIESDDGVLPRLGN